MPERLRSVDQSLIHDTDPTPIVSAEVERAASKFDLEVIQVAFSVSQDEMYEHYDSSEAEALRKAHQRAAELQRKGGVTLLDAFLEGFARRSELERRQKELDEKKASQQAA